MSRENVEIVRTFFELYRRGEHSAAAAYLAPEVVYEVGQELDTEPIEFIDGGDRVFVTVDYTGRGRGSGVPILDRTYEVYILRDGLCVRRLEFRSRTEALAATGLSG